MIIKLAWNKNAQHAHCNVFVGQDKDHLQLAGRLVMNHAEAEAFRATVRMGIQESGFSGIFESGWE